MVDALGRLGLFTSLTRASRVGIEQTAAAAEQAGFDALWLADVRGDLSFLEKMASATERLTIASAVLSIWDCEPHRASRAWRDAETTAPGRVLLGIGPSHPTIVATSCRTYDRPLGRMQAFLDALDSGTPHVPRESRILGANGPRMVGLAAERSRGTVTQNATVQRTRELRSLLGDGPTLAAEVKVVIVGDTETARASGRANMRHYLDMPSYRKNLVDTGFTAGDLADGGSDQLIDQLVAGPEPESIRARVSDYLAAGADHVCLHVLSPAPEAPVHDWAVLADILKELT